jgi:hypothetical protein
MNAHVEHSEMVLSVTFPPAERRQQITNLRSTDEFFPTLMGGGDAMLLCGHCGFLIAECVNVALVRGRVLLCHRCLCENCVP